MKLDYIFMLLCYTIAAIRRMVLGPGIVYATLGCQQGTSETNHDIKEPANHTYLTNETSFSFFKTYKGNR